MRNHAFVEEVASKMINYNNIDYLIYLIEICNLDIIPCCTELYEEGILKMFRKYRYSFIKF